MTSPQEVQNIADATERLATAMEAIAEQQRRQTYLIGVFVSHSVPHNTLAGKLRDACKKELFDEG